MGVLDTGIMTTNKGKEIDFSKAVIIATTNAAYQTIKTNIGFGKPSTSSEKANIKDLSEWFDPALLNRFEHRLVFHEISKETYAEIMADNYRREAARIKQEHARVNLPDDMPSDDLDKLVNDTYVPAFGARPVGRTVQKYIEDTVLAAP